jgi:hypothetical protein
MTTETDARRLAEEVKQACITAAREGYAQAAASGLCDEGAFEAAVGAMQMLDLTQTLDAYRARKT